MLSDWVILLLFVVTWIMFTALVGVTVGVALRLRGIEHLERSRAWYEQERRGLGHPVPELPVITQDGQILTLGQPPVAPAVVGALSQRSPPCQPVRDRLASLSAWLHHHHLFPVVARPTGEATEDWADAHAFLLGDAALSALGLRQFPSVLCIDRQGILRGRGPLRSPDDLLEIVSVVLLGLPSAREGMTPQ